jgi:hypothetical protein
MTLNWFKRKGIIFIPASLIGWIIFLSVLSYAVYSFIDIDKRSHSVSDTLRNFFFNLVILYAFYAVIALFTSRKD